MIFLEDFNDFVAEGQTKVIEGQIVQKKPSLSHNRLKAKKLTSPADVTILLGSRSVVWS